MRNLSKETTEVRWLDSTQDIGPVVGLLVDKMVKEEGKAPHTIATRSTVLGPDKTIVEIRIAWQLTSYEMDALITRSKHQPD